MPSSRSFLVALALSTTSMTGCEVKHGLDTRKVEDNIKSELEKQTGIKAKKVSCPDTVWEKKGDTFQCEATADDGTKIKIDVTMEGEGKVKWKTVGGAGSSASSSSAAPKTANTAEAAMLNVKNVEANIAEELEKQTRSKPASVRCPPSVVEKVAGTFECQATADDGSSATIEVTMQGNGNVVWKTVPAPGAPPAPPPAPPAGEDPE